MNPLTREPAVSAGTVAAVVALAAAFGFHLSAGVVGTVLAVLSLLLSVLVRSQVTPVAAKPQPPVQPPAHARP